MNPYTKIIEKVTAEREAAAAEKQAALKDCAEQHIRIKTLWDNIILPELTAAQDALVAEDIIADLGNGSFRHGTRRSLHLKGKTLVFMGIWSDTDSPAEILHHIEHGSPTDDTYGATTLGTGKEITPASIQAIIADFIALALHS